MSRWSAFLACCIGISGTLALTGCGGAGGQTGGTGGISGASGVPAGGSSGGADAINPPGGGSGGLAAGGGPAASGSGGVGTAGTSGGGAADCMHIDYSAYAAMPAVSFRQDILPIAGFACTLSSCHSPRNPKAGLNLGNRCAFDTSSKWKCTFPPAPQDPNDLTKPAPDDESTVAAVYASITAPSTTVNGGAVMRVKPGDPANSFLVLKLADQQNSRGFMCTNQDPASGVSPCGTSMPLDQDLFCEGSYRARFDAIAAWVAQGAKNN
jgi:hypothetical protein